MAFYLGGGEHTQYIKVREQLTGAGSLSPSAMWVPEIELKLSGFLTGADKVCLPMEPAYQPQCHVSIVFVTNATWSGPLGPFPYLLSAQNPCSTSSPTASL